MGFTPALLLAVPLLLAPRPAAAQPWARLAVPDILRAAAVRAADAGCANAWNALLVAELRTTRAAAAVSARRGCPGPRTRLA